MSTQEENRKIDLELLLHNYLKAAKRFWWLLLIGVLLFALLAPLAHMLFVTPEYTARCSFTVKVVNNSVVDDMDNSYDFYYDKSLAEQLEKTFSYILTSDHLHDEVYRKMDKELKANRITATCVKGSNLFILNAIGATPEEAVDLLNTVMDVFPDAARYIVGDLKVEMLEWPAAGNTPSNVGNRKAMAGLGGIGGFLLISALLLLPGWSHRTVRKPEELEEVLNMPCLGVVPQTSERMNNLSEGEFRESIRGISRKIETALEKKGFQVVLITSTLPGEGKSSMARFIAQTLAGWDKRVALLDGDLRNPTLYKQYKLKDKTLPLAAVLRGDTPASSIVCDVGIPNLLLIGNTQPVKNPTTLFDSPAFSTLIDQLRKTADIVIIDAPPCEMLSDALVLQKYADRILYVVRQDVATIKRIASATENLSKDESQLLGYVLNGTAKSAGGYGKYGYGSYSYGKYGDGYYGKYGYYSSHRKYYQSEHTEDTPQNEDVDQ